MKIFKLYIPVFVLFVTITGCGKSKKQLSASVDTMSVKEIVIRESDITKKEIGDFLTLDSYIILSNQELFGEVSRIIIDDEQIYLMDHIQRIFCYDMSGNLIYKIDQRGQGPHEYVNANDFGIDRISEKLFIYDDQVRKMLVFNKQTGNYISDFSIRYMRPFNFGITEGIFFFNNDDDRRVVDKKDQKYNLFYSETGKHIDTYFLPHDAIAEYHFEGGGGHPFFYNEEQLLYNKILDSRIYSLKKNQIVPLYDIILPNQLPMKKIEEKMKHIDVVRSSYSYALSSIFISGEIMHFIFSKDGFIQTCYYNLNSDQVLFCGPRVLAESRKNLPFYSLIQGVYNGYFFALISPIEIERRKEIHPDFFSEDLKNVTFDDNHVVAFYKIKE